MPPTRNDHLIPLKPGQAVNRGWTPLTGGRPAGVTWHWTVTNDLAACRRILGGPNAERKGAASAHFGVGRTFEEGIDTYVTLDNRSWHAGINQTLAWNGKPVLDARFKGSRTTIGIETVTRGYARPGVAAGLDWTEVAEPNGKHIMKVEPWTDQQIEMMVLLGKEIVAKFPNIRPDDHHGHHDICPTYKQDVAGLPFARVLRAIYDDVSIVDVWTPFLMPRRRQEALQALGYLGPDGADGDWGRMSDAALRRFQREHGMVEDGMWTVFVNRRIHQVMKARGIAAGFFPDAPSGGAPAGGGPSSGVVAAGVAAIAPPGGLPLSTADRGAPAGHT